LTVVLAARGYPGSFKKGSVIRGLDRAARLEGIEIFHAGTALRDGDVVANGGRVLGVTAVAPDLVEARSRAYRAVDLIDWPEGYFRRDIGWRGLGRSSA
jgi:phosphoribosylamine--glycine ligase